MYNKLQDKELQAYHKSVRYTGNFFLSDILNNSYFKTVKTGEYITIYPLFYTDEIFTDWDNVFIDSPYMITVPEDFKGLICFRGNDGQSVENREYTIEKRGDYYTIVIYNADTCEILPNQSFTVKYDNFDEKNYVTMDNGYFTFTVLEDSFEVIL